MNLSDLVPAYQAAMRRKLAATSLHGYASLTRSYLRALPASATLADMTEESIAAHLDDLEARRRRPATITGHLAALRSFSAWLVTAGHLTVNPTENIKSPKLDAPRREVPTDDQLVKLLKAIDGIPGAYRRALCRAVVTTAIFSGLRRFELLNLEAGDLEENGLLHVRRGKGGKPRDVLLCDQALTALRAYLAVRPDCDHPRLFLLRKNIAFGNEALRTLLRDLAELSGQSGDKALLPHSMRHAFASRLSENGMDLYGIMTVLGHADLKTTQKYLHSSKTTLQRASQLCGLSEETPPNVATPVPAPKPIDTECDPRNTAPAPALRLIVVRAPHHKKVRPQEDRHAISVPPPASVAPEPVSSPRLTLAEKRRAAWHRASA
jgi:integrase/recombinase XerD